MKQNSAEMTNDELPENAAVAATYKKKRGRPKGSKNKPKADGAPSAKRRKTSGENKGLSNILDAINESASDSPDTDTSVDDCHVEDNVDLFDLEDMVADVPEGDTPDDDAPDEINLLDEKQKIRDDVVSKKRGITISVLLRNILHGFILQKIVCLIVIG